MIASRSRRSTWRTGAGDRVVELGGRMSWTLSSRLAQLRLLSHAAGDELFEADAGHQLHAEQPLIGSAVDLFGKDLDDVLMFEPGHGAAFAAAVGGDLERDQAIERNLAGEVHVAERAAAEQADDFEVVDLRTGQQGHGYVV